MARRNITKRGTPAAAILSNGIRGWRAPSPREARLEQLARVTSGHGEMCPCSACLELRAL